MNKMEINVKLDAHEDFTGFDGPMDLLLHLIAKNKMNIYDINISELTDKYLSCIDMLDSASMESMSEFVVMAATLIEIKTRMLLPKPEKEEEDDGLDPREALVARLIEYKLCKQAAEELDSRQYSAGYSYYKQPDNELIAAIRKDAPKSIDDILYGADMDMLMKAFDDVLLHKEVRTDKVRAGFNSVTRETFTVKDRSERILGLLSGKPRITFKSIFEHGATKHEIVVTFFAMLVLIRTNRIAIEQDSLFGDIMIKETETKEESA